MVAVGPGRRNLQSGELIPVSVKEGDKVLLPEYGGQVIKLQDEECALCPPLTSLYDAQSLVMSD